MIAPVLRADREEAVSTALAEAGITYRRMSGYTSLSGPGTTALTFVHTDDHARAAEALSRLTWDATEVSVVAGDMVVLVTRRR